MPCNRLPWAGGHNHSWALLQANEVEDFWGNGLALRGTTVCIYMHWDRLAEGIAEGSRVTARRPEKFRFAFTTEPEILPTPNRALPPES